MPSRPRCAHLHPCRDPRTSFDVCVTLKCAVVTWVTNNPAVQRLVTDELLPAWRCALVAVIVWLKVTTQGDPVFPLHSTHRKPYELALVSRRVRAGDDDDPVATSSDSGGAAAVASSLSPLTPDDLAALGITDSTVPHYMCVSMPIGHSRKPPLDDMLTRLGIVTSGSRKLELFARNVRPGWTSVGDEVLYHQRVGVNFVKARGMAQCADGGDGCDAGDSVSGAASK